MVLAKQLAKIATDMT